MNKVALVTGASGDIGSSIATTLSKHGYNIIYQYNKHLNENVINAIATKTNCLPIKADLTNKADIENLVNSSIKTFGKIDLVVNCAGISSVSLCMDENYNSISNLINTNLTSVIYLTSLIIPHLNKQSSIINISSIWGQIGGCMESVYSASKAGLIGFTKALSKELGPSGVRVNAIAPGFIDTKMNNHLTKTEKTDFALTETSLLKLGTPEDVANLVLFLASDKAKYITGETIGVDGGLR